MTAIKAELTAAAINDLPDSAFACIDPGGEKDENGKTTPRSLRHYPHHRADGSLDLPHLRNALSRVAQEDTTTCGVSHLREHAEEAEVGAAAKMAVKFVEGSDNIIEGIGIPYGGPFAGKDIQGESFTKSTDFCLDWFEKRPLLYDHALNGTVKTYKVGDVFAADPGHDEGVFVKAELNKRGRYFNIVRKLIEQQALGFSSGAVPYLVQQDSKKNITRWPWFELSLTTTPANPDAVVYAVKASDALDHMDAANIEIPAPVEAALKAFDEWAIEQTPGDLEPEPLADQSERVSREVKAWVERLSARVDAREKEGRKALSVEAMAVVREGYQTLGQLITFLDQPSQDETEAAKSVAEHLRLEAELLGIEPG